MVQWIQSQTPSCLPACQPSSLREKIKKFEDYNKIGANGASDLGSALAKFTNLSNLTLYLIYNKIGANGASDLGSALAKFTNLSNLTLYLILGDKGASDLGSALAKCTNLSNLTLDLSGNQIGANGVSGLGSALAKCTNLSNLTLNLKNKQKNEYSKMYLQYLEVIEKIQAKMYDFLLIKQYKYYKPESHYQQIIINQKLIKKYQNLARKVKKQQLFLVQNKMEGSNFKFELVKHFINKKEIQQQLELQNIQTIQKTPLIRNDFSNLAFDFKYDHHIIIYQIIIINQKNEYFTSIPQQSNPQIYLPTQD
ncbi:hypothetical protein ABPG73_006512 [Tetrahymena malaccensis]